MAFTASTMANPITPLRIEADGSSSNFKAWSYGVDKHLLSRDVQGLDLKDEKADAAIISVFIASTPPELVNTFHNYPTSNAIWKHLQDWFMNKTAVGVAILIPSMFQVRLEDCSGMADYIAKVQTIHVELKELGIVFPEQAPAAALLVGLTTAYEITRKMLLTLTAEDLTFAKVSTALLSVEKDSTAQAKAYAIRALMPQASVAAALASAPLQRNRFPLCTYVVKYGNRKGQVCGGTNHPLATCFKKKDDEWYAVHGIDKRPPNWMRARKANLVEVQDPASASASDIAPADSSHSTAAPLTLCLNSSGLYTLQVPIPQVSTTQAEATTPPCSCRSFSNPTILYHHRLEHPNFRTLVDMASKKLLPDLPASLPPPRDSPAPTCLDCTKSKLRQQPHPASPSVAAAPLDLVHLDVWGPALVSARGGYRYFLVIVDDHSRYVSVHLLHTKAAVPEVLMAWVKQAQTTFDRKVKRLHSDGGGEFCNDKLKAFCSSESIQQNFTLPESPQQNGIAESRNHTLVQITRCLVDHSNAPHSLWGYALYHAALLYNLYPHPHLPDTTPTTLWLGKTPTARSLRVWGCTAYVLLNPQARRQHGGKLGPKTQTCIYLGHNADSPDYLFLNPSTQQLVRSRDVVFDETRPFYSTSERVSLSDPPSLVWADFDAPPDLPPAPAPSPPTPPATAPSPSEVSDLPSPVSSAAAPPSPSHAALPSALPPPSAPITYHRRSHPPAPPPPPAPPSSQAPAPPQPPELITYKRRPIPPPKPPKSIPQPPPAPPSSPVAHGTCSHGLGYSLLHDHFDSSCRGGSKGFTQQQYRDFFLTFSPTSKPPTIRTLMDVAAREDFEIKSMDASSAFLQGPPREWHNKVKEVLLSLDFHPSSADPTLFIRCHSEPFYILVYVDDFILVAKDSAQMTSVQAALSKALQMKDLGDLKHYLGMEITRDRQARTISLSQEFYIDNVLKRFEMELCTPVATPLPLQHLLTAPAVPTPEACSEPYPELVGSLMYAMMCIRPDLAYPVSVLSRYVAPGRFTDLHWKAAKRVLRYLQGTKSHVLTLGGLSPSRLEGYTDSSWADDQTDRRSSQGYCFTLGSGIVSWRSTRSSAVSLSSCEAELYAGTMAAQEARWLTFLLQELGFPQSAPTLWCDNQSTIHISQDPVYHTRTKHIELRHFFIRDLVQQEQLTVEYVASDCNLADLFTKPLGKVPHHRLLGAMGLCAPTSLP
ncbi:unnamed protein product [Closterium sp. NIES-54]